MNTRMVRIVRGALALTGLWAVACGGEEGGGGGGETGGTIRGFPDPTRAYPPLCVPGENCSTLKAVNGFAALAPDGEGGVWTTIPVGDANYTGGDAATLGELTVPTSGNAMSGDYFIAHVGGDLAPDVLVGMGDVGPSPRIAVGLDGALAVAGDFYTTLILGDQQFSTDSYYADSFLTVWDPAGGWRWAQTWNYDLLYPSHLAVAPDGALWLTGMIYGTTTLGGQEVSPGSPFPGLLFLASLDMETGALLSFETWGTARPLGLTFDEEGALYLTAMGLLDRTGDFKGEVLYYPEQVIARMDEGHTWHAFIRTVNGHIVESLPAVATAEGPVVAVNWNTAATYINNGQLLFGEFAALPMREWSDAALAGLDRETGEWRFARTGPERDGYIGIVPRPNGEVWTLEQIWSQDLYGSYYMSFRGICARLLSGEPRGCGYPQAATSVPTLMMIDGDVLWMANRVGEDGMAELTTLELP